MLLQFVPPFEQVFVSLKLTCCIQLWAINHI